MGLSRGQWGQGRGVVWEGFLQEEGMQASLVGKIGCPRRADYSHPLLSTCCIPGIERVIGENYEIRALSEWCHRTQPGQNLNQVWGHHSSKCVTTWLHRLCGDDVCV